MYQLWEFAVNPVLLLLRHDVGQQLPLQLHWIFPSQTGGAVTHSPAGLVGADGVFLLEGGDSLLDSRHQPLHSQILNTVSTYSTYNS